ncbi:hypothetical protein B0T14DRAFT_568311 [Immersiella caudata]|uniref:Zn(2)-C6 fungal-type domain-containing protein n=1 Tax=Immersiella caudata TaxID=314043 RepID=A0AA40BX04_9PEZI|nr:hypothetical protein B0T14DRAFT_568311 [Immersiella caudata]
MEISDSHPQGSPTVRRRIRPRKACVQCTRSKRKCDKRAPQLAPEVTEPPEGQITHGDLNHLGLSFLHPDSWHRSFGLEPIGESCESRISEEDLPKFIANLQQWMKTWLTNGHCPIIHCNLYRGQMPQCIQDAFTSLAAYHSATPHTKSSVLRIIRDRADRLINSQPVPTNLDIDPENPMTGFSSRSSTGRIFLALSPKPRLLGMMQRSM